MTPTPKPVINATWKPASAEADGADADQSNRVTIPSGVVRVGDASWAGPPTAAELRAIDAMHARVGGTYYEVLGVRPDVAAAVIQAAHVDLMRRFHPDLFEGRVTPQCLHQIEAIVHAITAAVSTLAHPARRTAYDATLAWQKEASPDPKAVTVQAPLEPPPGTMSVVTPVAKAQHVTVTDDFRAAARLAKKARARDPRAEEADASPKSSPHVALAGQHERAKRWGAAVTAWKAACAEHPKDVDVHLGLVRAACEGLVELEMAGDYARIATRIAPKSADAAASLARVLLLQGCTASARETVTRALALDAEHPLALDLARRLKR